MSSSIVLVILLLAACQPARASDSRATTASPDAPKIQPVADANTPTGADVDSLIEAERAALDAAFEAQPFDESWRTVQESRFRAEVAKFRNNSAVVSVECRQTLCKLVFREDPNDRKRGLFRLISKAIPDDDRFNTQMAFRKYPDQDKIHATVYVARNHYSLPDKDGKVTEKPKQAAPAP
jgi:hypothetical protein